jgi:acyl-CoA synthetase (AMP-forming)/AMP-acid ligase II/thioesterase domain-containing protein
MRVSVGRDISASSSLLLPRTIEDAIAQHAAHDPDRPAIVGTAFSPFSFRELDSWIKQIGQQLRAAGIGPHARVGIMLPRGPEGAVLAVAVASYAVSVSLNPNRPETEIEDELARVGLDALVLPSWAESPGFTIARTSSFGLFEATPATGSLANVALRQTREAPVPTQTPVNAALDSVALIFTTSGTTGTPKLIPVTHENLLVTADKMRQWFNLSPDDRTAFVLPGYYGAAIKISFLAPLLLGQGVGLPTARHVEDLAEWVPKLRPTWLWGNPTFFQAVLDALRAGARPKLTHSLRFVVSGTAYLPPRLRTELEATLGVPVLQSYGMSEAGILAADPAPPAKRKPGTTGLISRHELAIIGPNGEVLPDGEVGEIVVHGPTVSPALGADIEGQRSGDRRLFTGDLGSIDSDGYLTVVGRTKELINRGGEKISPYEVETALLRHPSVQEAAAFSVPHPRLGENVAAAVVLKSEPKTTVQEIKGFLNDRLASFKVPQHVFIMSEIPRGETGKVARTQLSQIAADRIRNIAPPVELLEFQILEIWQRLIGRANIGIDDDFFDAGGDSLLALKMVLEVEAIIRQYIPLSAIRAAYTVRQLAAAVLRMSPSSEERVTCAKDGRGLPLFFCHGDFTTRGFYALKLADMLTCGRPVFLVHPYLPGPKLTIEEMARSYVPHLLAAQPTGAFRLAGHCNGGLLAYELAFQLDRLGRQVEVVVLVNTISLNARLALRIIAQLMRFISIVSPKTIGEKIKLDGMRAIWNRLKRTIYPGPYLRAMSNYVPPKLRSTVLVVLCEENRVMKEYSAAPWTRLAPNVRSRYISGGHHSCLTIHASELAFLLDGLLSTEP